MEGCSGVTTGIKPGEKTGFHASRSTAGDKQTEKQAKPNTLQHE
jgi:hypothetical protein